MTAPPTIAFFDDTLDLEWDELTEPVNLRDAILSRKYKPIASAIGKLLEDYYAHDFRGTRGQDDRTIREIIGDDSNAPIMAAFARIMVAFANTRKGEEDAPSLIFVAGALAACSKQGSKFAKSSIAEEAARYLHQINFNFIGRQVRSPSGTGKFHILKFHPSGRVLQLFRLRAVTDQYKPGIRHHPHGIQQNVYPFFFNKTAEIEAVVVIFPG